MRSSGPGYAPKILRMPNRFGSALYRLGSFLLVISAANASTLHFGCISPTICSSNGIDYSLSNNPSTFQVGLNGTLTPIGAGYDFYLIALVPANESSGFSTSFSATNTQFSSASPTFDGTFTNGTELNTVLDTIANGFTNVPNGHPFSSNMTATRLVDATASAYSVYSYDFGNIMSAINNPVFTDGAMPVGTVFTFIATTKNTQSVVYDSPNGEGLLVTVQGVSQSPPPVPEPASLSLIGAAIIGFAVMRRRSQGK
jgi:hypothetical protein